MLFNSYEFIFIFLPSCFIIYFYLNKHRLTEVSKGFIALSSLFFYSYWNLKYLPLILISMLFNYVVGSSLSANSNYKTISRKGILVFAIIGNLCLLGYFKYSDFLLFNINAIFGSKMPLMHLALPLAISFFTFQQIAYLIDSFKKETHEYDFLNYSVFVSFFPQLIAGPIVHHKEMMPQFKRIKNKAINHRNIAIGIILFSIGLFKKVVLADNFAIYATYGFDVAASLDLVGSWITSLSYSFQLYFDFSGYTDMAMGAAMLFNIKLPINFNSPYKSTNIQDFWRKWHITLSRFLRDYIYIPLGGNKKGELRKFLNILITFSIGGIWHGAGWTFVLWGLLHGIAIIIMQFWKKTETKLHYIVSWLITFNFVNVTWIFFRANSWHDVKKVLSGMLGMNDIILPGSLGCQLSFLSQYGVKFGGALKNIKGDGYTYFYILMGFILVLAFKNTNKYMEDFKLNYYTLLMSVILFVYGICYLNRATEFLYFNF